MNGAGNTLPWPGYTPAAAVREPAAAPWLVHYRRIGSGDPAFWLFAADVLGTAAAVAAVLAACGAPQAAPAAPALAFGVFVLTWSAAAQIARLYAREAMLGSLRRQLLGALTVLAVALSAVLGLAFAGGMLGREPGGTLAACGGAALWVALTRFVWRGFWHRLLASGYRADRVLVLAETADAARGLAARLVEESRGVLGVAGHAALPGGGGAPSLEWVESTARSGLIDRVVLLAGGAATMARVNTVLARLARLAIDVSVLPDLGGLAAPVLKVDRVGMLPAIELDFRPLSDWQLRIKRAEDLVLAGLITLFVLPVLAVVALAVKLDTPGPVFFRQKRTGFNDRVFEVWKFRTMHAHLRDEAAVRQTSRDDDRVTRVGRVLRRTSLDELPQLFNVLLGSMSLVGPRPHALGMTSAGAALHDVIEDYSARHRLKPGITGWAQVNGSRGEVRTHEELRRRVALDCYYIERWSLRLDLWILARTAALVLFDANAY